MVVILSTPLLLEEGLFSMKRISLQEAEEIAVGATNFVGHSTVRILGVEPSQSREACLGYDQAIVLKVNGRLDFGREYSIDEIDEIGYTIFLISKME